MIVMMISLITCQMTWRLNFSYHGELMIERVTEIGSPDVAFSPTDPQLATT